MTTAATRPFTHIGLLYRDHARYQEVATRFVRDALAADRPVLVAVPPPSLQMLQQGLGRDSAAVDFVDMSEAGRNPAGIIPGVLLPFATHHRGRRVAIIGEPIWAHRRSEEYPVCVAHEALINLAFAGRDAEILCPYDASGLAAQAIGDAHSTHPLMADDVGKRWPSDGYGDPVDTAERFNRPLPPPATEVVTRTYRHATDLAGLRAFVTARARAAGLSESRGADLAVAVTELAANTVRHTRGAGQMSLWTERSAVVCQVDDSGHLTDPLAGRLPAPPGQLGGRGLLLVNMLCDLVRVHTRPCSTSIRIYCYLPGR